MAAIRKMFDYFIEVYFLMISVRKCLGSGETHGLESNRNKNSRL